MEAILPNPSTNSHSCEKVDQLIDSTTQNQEKIILKIKIIPCQLCSQKFRKQDEYDVHIENHKNKLKRIAKVLNNSINVIEQAMANKDNGHKQANGKLEAKVYSCESCPERFSNMDEVYQHGQVAHCNPMPVQVNLVEYIEDDFSLYCPICNEQFSDNSALEVHKTVHEEYSSKDTDPESLSLGIMVPDIVQEIKQEPSEYVEPNSYQEKAHRCNVCKKHFSMKSYLKKHMKLHSDVRPFSCDICKQAFKLKTTLRDHLMIHTGERPFRCNMCPKAFRQSYALKTHMRYHSGVKPFECTVCYKNFTELRTLTEHLKIHTGEKPFMCEFCGKNFRQKVSLKHHRMVVHIRDKAFSCLECGKEFSTKPYLNRHSCHFGETSLRVKPKGITTLLTIEKLL